MVDFVASTVLSAANLDAAFNAAVLNTQTGITYSLVSADQGEIVVGNNASGLTITIPTNAVVPLAIGTHIGILNIGAGNITVVGAVGVTVTPTTRTVSTDEAATLIKTATNTWRFVRGGFPKALVSSSTAATVTSVTTGGLPAKVYRFTGTGSLTFLTAGLVDVICQGPGGVAADGSGGAGGFVSVANVFVSAGSRLVYIGAGMGGTLLQGNLESSFFSGVVATGGGSGAQYYDRQPSGGACGGGSGPFASSSYGVGARFQGVIAVSAGVTRGGNGAGVNGGGGGGVSGTNWPCGGGGGQVLASNFTLSVATNYTITVGNGGAQSGFNLPGNDGNNSIFSSITALKGKGAPNSVGGKSGSGFAGGSHNISGGGGGGNSSVGLNATSASVGGNGGNGSSNTLFDGSTKYYGGGGGGGAGGTAGTGGIGGGGSSTSGTVNTGGGGGCVNNANIGLSGGSGIVIIKYPDSYTLTIGGGLTSSTATSGGFKVTSFTAGTGNISFA